MSIDDIVSRLSTITDVPLAYFKFPIATQPPFMVYLIKNEQLSGSDDKNLIRKFTCRIELYTANKDFDLQEKIEKLFDDVEIDVDTVWIDEEKLYLTAFEFTTFDKLFKPTEVGEEE